MSSDLVLDEIDGYEPEAMVAVLRLVQLAALFRRNVICSSATLSLPVATAIERAFRSGVDMLNRLESHKKEGQLSVGFIRAMIDDELPPQTDYIEGENAGFSQVYQARRTISPGASARNRLTAKPCCTRLPHRPGQDGSMPYMTPLVPCTASSDGRSVKAENMCLSD